MPYIDEPTKIPLFLKLALRFAERKTGRRMLPGRLLAWYPKAALGAGILEALVAHGEPEVSKRLLKLIRVQVSFSASCSFCIDMNAFEFERTGLDREEILYLQEPEGIEACPTFSEKEKVALAYVRQITSTPISINPKTLTELRNLFSEKGIVIIVSTAAQVNFWTRLIQGLGIPPAGFNESCTVLNLDKYGTLQKPDDSASE